MCTVIFSLLGKLDNDHSACIHTFIMMNPPCQQLGVVLLLATFTPPSHRVPELASQLSETISRPLPAPLSSPCPSLPPVTPSSSISSSVLSYIILGPRVASPPLTLLPKEMLQRGPALLYPTSLTSLAPCFILSG